MAVSSIDVDAARDVARQLRTLAETVGVEWRAAQHAADQALCDTDALRGLFDPVMTLGNLASQLEERAELAVLVDTAHVTALGSTGTDGRISVDLGDDDSPEAVRSAIAGLHLATELTALDPDDRALNRSDVERMAACADHLRAQREDPVAMAAMVAALGPEGTLRVPQLLRDLGTSYTAQLPGLSGADLMWDDRTHIETTITGLQDDLLESLGIGLGAATRAPGSAAASPSFAANLSTAATQSPATGQGWALAQLLGHGVYGEGFLANLGAGLIDGERRNGIASWSDQGSGDVPSWTLGTHTADPDPLTALLDATTRTPAGGLMLLNPDQGAATALDRMTYLLSTRRWPDGGASLGRAVDAAATSFRGTGGPVQQADQLELTRATQSAWIASAAVHLLAVRPDGTPDAMKGSVGHLLGTYIYDVDRTATAARRGHVGVVEPAATQPWELALRTGAAFKFEELRTVLADLATDESGMQAVTAGAAYLNAERMQSAAALIGSERGASEFHNATNAASFLSGFLVGTFGRGLLQAADDTESSATAYIDFASALAGLVPEGGTIAAFLAEQAGHTATSSADPAVGSPVARAKATLADVTQSALSDLIVQVGAAVARAGAYAPNGNIDARTGQHYPWFREDGTYEPSNLGDADIRDQFIHWTNGTDSGPLTTEVIPDIAAMFRDGEKRGEGL